MAYPKNREKYKYIRAYEKQRHNQVHTPKLGVPYMGGNVNIRDYNSLYPQVALVDPPYSTVKSNWDYQDTDSIMVSEKDFSKFSQKDQQFVKQMMRRFDRYHKRLYVAQTWQFGLGEAMRKWLHQLGALHVSIDYIEMSTPSLNEICLEAIFSFHNQQIQLIINYDPTLIQNPDGQIMCYRFRLRSKDDTMNYSFQFADITKMEYYLNVLTGLYENDMKISMGDFGILLGEKYPDPSFK